MLLTGFEPFGGETINPSTKVADALHGQLVRGHRIESVVLPVTFAGALKQLLSDLERVRPSLVISLGQAGGEEAVRIERVAINLKDARIPDNDGIQPTGQSVEAGGPVAYWSSLPVTKVASAIAAASIPVIISNSAGTFVCNHVFYGLMNALAARPGVRGGFVHLPYLPEQVQEASTDASMALETMVEAIRIAIVVTL